MYDPEILRPRDEHRGAHAPAGQAGFVPIAVVETELTEPLEPIPDADATGQAFGAARLLGVEELAIAVRAILHKFQERVPSPPENREVPIA